MLDYNRIQNKILIFFISPIISAITSLKDIRDGVSHKFLYAWFIIFGISFCAVNEAADSFRDIHYLNISLRLNIILHSSLILKTYIL